MTQMAIEEIEAMIEDATAVVAQVYVGNPNDPSVAKFIEDIRAFHREIGDIFIGHACACTSFGGTKWMFAYEPLGFFENNYPDRVAEICTLAMPDAQLEDESFVYGMATQPCVCPFSMG